MCWIDDLGVVRRDLDGVDRVLQEGVGERTPWVGIRQEVARAASTDVEGGTYLGFYVESLDGNGSEIGRSLSASPTDISFVTCKAVGPLVRDPNGVNIQLFEVGGRPGVLPVLARGALPK